jgi:hypothetical protein
MAKRRASTVMTLRVPREIEKRIEQEARRRRRTKSAVVREVIEGAFSGKAASDPAAEARRQSLLVSGRASEKEALKFVEDTADVRGWK